MADEVDEALKKFKGARFEHNARRLGRMQRYRTHLGETVIRAAERAEEKGKIERFMIVNAVGTIFEISVKKAPRPRLGGVEHRSL